MSPTIQLFIFTHKSNSPKIMGDILIISELLNYGWHFELWVNLGFMGKLFSLWFNLDFFQWEIGFLLRWNWISSHVKYDFFQFDIAFLSMWNWIYSFVILDFFQYEIRFLQRWSWISSNVKLDFFQKEMDYF